VEHIKKKLLVYLTQIKNKIHLNEKLKVGIISVLEAGKKIAAIYQTDFKVKMKAENDPVTLADMEAHYTILDAISKNFPEDLLLSEEDIPTWERRSNYKNIWILDPLDGTRDFVEKNPEFAVSLGYVENGLTKFGILYNPISNELFFGGENIPFFTDKLVSEQDPSAYVESIVKENLDTSLPKMHHSEIGDTKLFIYVSKNEWKDGLFRFLENDENIKIQGIGSIAYKLGLLARNDCHLILSLKPKNEWDICAGVAILHGLGMTYLDLENLQAHRFNKEITKSIGFIAGYPQLVESFLLKYKPILQTNLKDWS
jgi:myo-inositol-1(or 4)-monophosphatase